MTWADGESQRPPIAVRTRLVLPVVVSKRGDDLISDERGIALADGYVAGATLLGELGAVEAQPAVVMDLAAGALLGMIERSLTAALADLPAMSPAHADICRQSGVAAVRTLGA